MLFFVLACRQALVPEPSSDPTEPVVEPTSTTPAPCDEPGVPEIVEVQTTQPWQENEALVTVRLSNPARVAVVCTHPDDPEERHLVESDGALQTHELRLAGLLADTTYDCRAAAVCPASSAPQGFALSTGAQAPGFFAMVPQSLGNHGMEYILLNQTPDCADQFQRLVVADREGRVRWWYRTTPFVGKSIDFRYHGANQFAWGGGWAPKSDARPRKVDLYDGEVYDSADAMPDVATSEYHHDGKQLPDGRLLTLEEEPVATGFGSFTGFRVRRIDPNTNTVDFEYSSQRAFDEGHLPPGFGDAWHANWVDIVDNTLYVSLCFLSRVIAIDVSTGDFRWSFGPDQDFDLFDVQGKELGSDEFTECQHGLEMTSDGRLLVYDNGAYRGIRDYSRATAYQLDEANARATLLWTWTEPDWFETTLGSIDELPSGHVLIGAAHAECFTSNPGDRTTILEFDPVSGDKLWELRYKNEFGSSYRADWADACTLFGNAKYCPDVALRIAELASVFEPTDR
ncbi:MAG: aryl-sulfate sulfotransferase [Myxococcota bacterium]